MCSTGKLNNKRPQNNQTTCYNLIYPLYQLSPYLHTLHIVDRTKNMFAYCVCHIHRNCVQIQARVSFRCDTPFSRYGVTQLQVRHTGRFRGSFKPLPQVSGKKEVTPEDSQEDRICMAHWSFVISFIRLRVQLTSHIPKSGAIPRGSQELQTWLLKTL